MSFSKTSMMFLFALLLFGCSPKVHKIGQFTLISNRNLDNMDDYVLLRSYMGASEDEINATESTSVDDALDQTLKNTPGGEFLKNIKLYLVEKGDKKYFAVEGDVWGILTQPSFRGFVVGDRVQWKTLFSTKTGLFSTRTGTIIDLKDSKECTVKVDDSGDFETVEYEDLLKIK